jgi:hypothetical protein
MYLEFCFAVLLGNGNVPTLILGTSPVIQQKEIEGTYVTQSFSLWRVQSYPK